MIQYRPLPNRALSSSRRSTAFTEIVRELCVGIIPGPARNKCEGELTSMHFVEPLSRRSAATMYFRCLSSRKARIPSGHCRDNLRGSVKTEGGDVTDGIDCAAILAV